MLKKIHPDHLRYALLGLNLLLTAFMAWCGFWTFGFNKVLGGDWWRRVDGFAAVKDPVTEYAIPDEAPVSAGVGSQPALIATTFEPKPPAPELPQEEEKEEVAEEIVEEGGPLQEKWELTSAYLSPDRSKWCAFIAEKAPESAAGRYPARRTYPTTRTPSRTTRSTAASRYTRTTARKSKLWPLNGEVKIDEAVYLLVDIVDARDKPLSIVYRAGDAETKYVLRKEEKDRNPLELGPEEEEEEESTTPGRRTVRSATASAAEAGGIKVRETMLGKKTESETESGSGATTTASTKTSTVRRTMTAKEKKDFRDVLNKMPASERSKVTKAFSRGRRP